MKEATIKMTLSIAFATLSAHFGELVIPLIILIAVMFLDLITGLAKAYMLGTLSSKIGAKGLLRKVLKIVLVAVAMIVDLIIDFGLTSAGVDVTDFGWFAILVCVWIVCNELISILENLSKAGVSVPNFLLKIIDKLKITAEKQEKK